jgi:uncharacterized protein (DUF362 family)
MTWQPSVSRLTRREFLGTIPIAAALAACRMTPYRREDFALPVRSPVALLPAPNYGVDLVDVVSRGLRMLDLQVQNRSVLLKPNLVEYEAGTAVNTHPALVAATAIAFRLAGASEVVVGEGPGHRRDIEYLLTATGLNDHVNDARVRWVDLNHCDVRSVRVRSHFTGLDELLLPEEVLKADILVSMPKLKTHHWAGMTAGMKNLFGTVPGAVYGWPKNLLHARGINNSILDLNATLRPQFTIVDAIVAMEGDGPIMGRPREMGFVAMGSDTVAVDATCARIMGLDPDKILYLRVASRFLGNLGLERIEQRAESPARYRTRFEVVDSLKYLRLESDGRVPPA